MQETKFTVIMAVYNVGNYIREAIDSVIRQNIGFAENVQLILVDDGSNDDSGAICDEYALRYPEQILVLHQENQGVSAARNKALPFVRGKYINFLDADDKLSETTLSDVWLFFENHYDEIDVVGIPIFFFEGKTGPHPLNEKFSKGSRVIDLQLEWDCIQLSMSSSFIKRDCMRSLTFQTDLHYGEDSELLLKILLERKTLGVVAEAKYHYRQRSQGEASAIQKSRSDKGHYLPKLEGLTEGTLKYCNRRYGEVPKFVQYSLMYDLQWIIRRGELPKGLLTKEEEQEYLERVYRVIAEFDDEVILSQRYLPPEYQYFLMRKKHGIPANVVNQGDEWKLIYDGIEAGNLEETKIAIDFIKIDKQHCTIEGYVSFLPVNGLKVNTLGLWDRLRIESIKTNALREETAFGEVLWQLQGFEMKFPLPSDGMKHTLQFAAEINGICHFPEVQFGRFSPVSEEYDHGYYIKDNWCLKVSNGTLLFSPASRFTRAENEIPYLWELLTHRQHHRRKAAIIRMAYWAMKHRKRHTLWMISDRRDSAGDNGEVFFRYIREHHPEIEARFILRKGSAEYESLSRIGTVIQDETIQEKLTALLCDCIISSQGEQDIINPMIQYHGAFRDMMADKPFIFLQHGVIHDDLSSWIMRPKKNVRGFVTSAEREYQSLLGENYGYTEKEVWLTGLPRFDRYHTERNKRLITIMPTWRSYLAQSLQDGQPTREQLLSFEDSNFFRYYHELLRSPKLLETAKQRGYQVAFLCHPRFRPFLSLFLDCQGVEMLGSGTSYQKVYENSALVVTDYSSAVFDAVYLNCPVLYTQFDADQFFSGEHTTKKGYFDFERDGFGEVEYTMEGSIARIIEYMENGCTMKEKYQKRADEFFAFRDRNNCRRVYDKIMEIET